MLKSMQEVLELGFDVLNEVYFEGKLPPIVITIMSSPRSNGHFTIGREWRVNEEHFNEINISAEHLDRPIENVMATLCHEMVHYYCQISGIADTSQNNRYHNKNFKREAEARGLLIGYEKYIGYSVTKPGEDFIKLIRARGIEKPIDINRDGEHINPAGLIGGSSGGDSDSTMVTKLPPKAKSSTRKYQCPCCKNSFRATKEINVLCMDCNVQFVKVEN